MGKLRIKVLLSICMAVLSLISCQDQWENHYQKEEKFGTQNLVDLIQSQSDLKIFAEMLKITGYDTIISKSQSYTVWAPSNDALTDIDLTNEKECLLVVKNHIARFSKSAAIVASERIYMKSGKFVTFERVGGHCVLGGQTLTEYDLLATNGILHKLSHRVEYTPNFQENLDLYEDFSLISKYIHSFDEKIFMESQSTQIGVNENGKVIYDSVFIYRNSIYNRLGFINEEDSVYTMICPTDGAWEDAYNRIKPYYRTCVVNKGDSITDSHTKSSIVRDLVFRKVQKNPASLDSLISTSKTVFYDPKYLFEGMRSQPVSNGLVYIADRLNHHPWDSWQKELKIEAEYGEGRTNLVSVLSSRSAMESEIREISNYRYLEVVSSNSIVNPSVTFSIPNTLAASYNIYCVFVPGNVEVPTNVKDSTKVSFEISYIKNGQTKPSSQKLTLPGSNITSPTKLTKMLIAENFKFPYANYNEKLVTVTLKAAVDVLPTEKKLFSRNMNIDCIILEPVH